MTMGESPDLENKPIGNGLANESEDSGNTSEQDPCLPTDINCKKEKDNTSDTLDSKHLDTEILKQNKKRLNINKKPHISLWTTICSSFSSMVKYLKEKSGLSNVGLAVAVVVLLLLLVSCVILIVMTAIWPTVPHEVQFPICRKTACLRSSSEILPRMNTNVSACDDFREFACGQWFQAQTLPADRRQWSLRRQLEYKTRDRLRQLIMTQPHPTQHSAFSWKTKYFYDSCMALDNIETAKEITLISDISELGGWNVLREFQVHSFDLRNTFTRLHSQFGVSLFFKVDVVPDPNSAQDFIIQIMPANLGLPDKSFYYRSQSSVPVMAYKRYLKDVVQLLGATSNDAASFSEDMFFFEKRLAEVTPDTSDLQPLQAANKLSLADLRNLAPSIPLHDILSSKYPEGNVDDNTLILIPFPDHLRNISNLISTTDRTSINNYMMWRLMDNFLPFLSEKFRDSVAVFRRDLFGEQQPLERWEFCIQTMQQFMGFGLAVLLQNHAENFNRDVQVVDEIFREVLRETKHAVDEATWLPQHLQDHITAKLMTMSLEVGFPRGGTLLRDANLEEVYRQMLIINRDFFRNVQNCIRYLQKQQQFRLSKYDEIYRWVDAASNFDDVKVRYIAASNKVVVPQALLQEPNFHPDYPLSVLYGGLGVEISSVITQAISPWDILYTDDGTLLVSQDPAFNQSERAFLHPVSCLRRWWGKEGFASPLASNHTTFNALIKLSAVNIAQKTLQEQLKHLPHIHQPALESFEDGQLFFITYAQSMCSIKSSQQKDLDETLDLELDDRSLLPVVLSQSREFSKLFSCSAANVLYTEIPCEDIL